MKIQTSGSIQEAPKSVSQSTTLNDRIADWSIDGNITTVSFTTAAYDKILWYKMYFEEKHCFSEIVIAQSQLGNNAYRMDDTKVSVVDTGTGSENLCGILKTKKDWTIEGQTYRIPCDLKCGNEVKLTVIHTRKTYSLPACIHMREIVAYSKGLCFRYLECGPDRESTRLN